MKRRHIDEGQENIFSAPVDVLANTVLVMFLYVVFFLLAIRSDNPALPTLFDIQFPSGISGLPYEYIIPSSGGVGPRKLIISKGHLPKNLTLNEETGTVSGIVPPSNEDSIYHFTVRLEDPFGFDEKDYTIQIAKSVIPLLEEDFHLKLTNESKKLKEGRIGQNYEAIIGHIGGAGEIEWLESGPKSILNSIGLELKDGRIFGVPKKDGEFDILIEARFPKGYTKFRDKRFNWDAGVTKKKFNLKIRSKLNTIKELPFIRVNQDVRLEVATALLPDEIVTFENLPIRLDGSKEGVITGKINKKGVYVIKYNIQKDNILFVKDNIELKVLPPMPKPTTEDIFISARLNESSSRLIPYSGLIEPVSIEILQKDTSSIQITDHTIKYIPQSEGESLLRLQLTDALGTSLITNCKLLGLPPLKKLKFDIPDELNLLIHKSVKYPVATNGGIGTPQISFQGNLPSGMNIDNNVLEGAPSMLGEWNISLSAVDTITKKVANHNLLIRSTTKSIESIKIQTTTLPSAIVGKKYEVSISTKGAIGEIKWNVSGSLPDGLELLNGRIVGIPEKRQKSIFTLVATDSIERKDTMEDLSIETYYSEESNPVVLTSSIPVAVIGEHYNVSLSAEGGIGKYNWDLKGDLPTDFSFKNGLILGEPTLNTEGEWGFVVSVSDERNNTSKPVQLKLVIKKLVPFDPFSIRVSDLPNASVNKKYDVNLAFEDKTIHSTKWQLIGVLPAGLNFLGGRINGVPRLSEEKKISVVVSENNGRKHTRDYVIKVDKDLSAPENEHRSKISILIGNKWMFIIVFAIGLMFGLIIYSLIFGIKNILNKNKLTL